MISQQTTELFELAKAGLKEEQIQHVDEIWDKLEASVSALDDSSITEGLDESAAVERKQAAEKSAVVELTLYLQEMIDNLKEESEILERKNRFLYGAKIYPNEPCPCGSGKKYKKCCGLLASRVDSPLIKELIEQKED